MHRRFLHHIGILTKLLGLVRPIQPSRILLQVILLLVLILRSLVRLCFGIGFRLGVALVVYDVHLIELYLYVHQVIFALSVDLLGSHRIRIFQVAVVARNIPYGELLQIGEVSIRVSIFE